MCVTLPNIKQSATTNCMRAGNSLESRDLGVLEGGCESNHARHVFAVIGEVVLGQAASTSECKRTSRFKA